MWLLIVLLALFVAVLVPASALTAYLVASLGAWLDDRHRARVSRPYTPRL